MSLVGKKIGILLESDFYEPEIFYYERRFAEEGIDVHFLTRLWGQEQLTFKGHEFQIPYTCQESFEAISDEYLNGFSAIIVPSGMVADRLRYTEDINVIPPASAFMERAFQNETIIKGIICHGMWIMAPITDRIKGRKAVVHNNLLGDARSYGINYINEDVVVDGDLITARTGGHCHFFAKKILEKMRGEEGGEF